ncbi:MAG: 16S rRNA (cytidine(1402)-2'-O)-methyltransferase [FCB group bacterium]|nr:16S rRNA (cytidine(1402)-2'-O)-methyltransferase [FCB group bacterium]
MSGILYVVATPIGNLADLTLRAVETLNTVDHIAAEDTRKTGKLLKHYQIDTPMLSYHEHNEGRAAEQFCERLKRGENIALVSDAGTPCISDPGYRIVHLAHDEGIPVRAIPGASAVSAALSVSGLPTDHFYFEGFLPRKKGRKTRLEFLAGLPATLVIYESPYRVSKSLQDLLEVLGERETAVCREMTKLYEEIFRGSLSEAVSHFGKSDKKIRGEFVIILAREGYQG